MVAETRLEACRRGLTAGRQRVRVRHMSAEQLSFPDQTFEAVICGFALPFMPRLGLALSEMRRVLRPGGRLVASTWGDEDPRWARVDELFTAHGAVRPMRAQALETPADLAEALRGAGFGDVQVVAEAYEQVYDSPEDWWANMWSISMRAGLEQLDPTALERLRAEAFAQVEALREARGIPMRLQALIGIANQ
jgi:SAM-dependent methyltransferase